MKKIRIVSDSTCDLSAELIEKYDITIIPLCIILGEKSYYDGVDISPAQIYEWSDENKTTPKTAGITFDKLDEFIKPLFESGDDIIYIGISEDMSSTCNTARIYGEDAEYGRFFVINSKNLSTKDALTRSLAPSISETISSALLPASRSSQARRT